MEMLNRATEDAAAFQDLLRKVQQSDTERMQAVARITAASPEVLAWNAEVDRKRVEKKARKAQHTKALDGLR